MEQSITFRYDVRPSLAAAEALAAVALGRQKKLRRLPHVFSKILVLPLPSDAGVSVLEDAGSFRFVAATGEIGGGGVVEARAVEVHPGLMKVVVTDGFWGIEDEELECERWCVRLPPSTCPALATAAYVGGELVVTVPKGGEGFRDFISGGIGGGMVAVQ